MSDIDTCARCGWNRSAHQPGTSRCPDAPDFSTSTFRLAIPYVIGHDHRQLEIGERVGVHDERKSGMADGQWERVPKGMVGGKVDASLTIRRYLIPNTPQASSITPADAVRILDARDLSVALGCRLLGWMKGAARLNPDNSAGGELAAFVTHYRVEIEACPAVKFTEETPK